MAQKGQAGKALALAAYSSSLAVRCQQRVEPRQIGFMRLIELPVAGDYFALMLLVYRL